MGACATSKDHESSRQFTKKKRVRFDSNVIFYEEKSSKKNASEYVFAKYDNDKDGYLNYG